MHSKSVTTLALLLATSLAASAQTPEPLAGARPENALDASPRDKWHLYEPLEFAEKRLTDPALGGDPHIYRVLCYPSFAPPVSVRLHVHEAGNGTVFVKRMDHGWSSDGRPHLRLITDYAIDAPAVSKFLGLMQSLDFWALQPKPIRPGCDGSTWVLEGLRAGTYHSVSRGSPAPDSFLDTARLLLSYGGLDACGSGGLLGQHKLGKLEYIGFMVTGDPPRPVAIVRTPDGLVERARPGDYLGINFGLIREITEDFIRITEIIKDGQGGYAERENRLVRKVSP